MLDREIVFIFSSLLVLLYKLIFYGWPLIFFDWMVAFENVSSREKPGSEMPQWNLLTADAQSSHMMFSATSRFRNSENEGMYIS